MTRDDRQARKRLGEALDRLGAAADPRPAESAQRAHRALERLEASCCPHLDTWTGELPRAFLRAHTCLARVAIGEVPAAEGAREVRRLVEDALERLDDRSPARLADPA